MFPTLDRRSKEFYDSMNLWIHCAKSTITSRHLCETRGSVADPAYMEAKVRDLIKVSDKCEIEVLDHNKLQEQGMNLFYNVGKGADVKPRCVIVKYTGNPDSKDVDVAFVGKGVTYDTGGLNIKPTGAMEKMYGDKGGACAVIGALKGTIRLKLKLNIVFSMGFADNAIGSSAFKPGDILKAMNGLNVEIGNTDAEGRLVMSDTMTYVQRNYKPKQLVDLATLTGSMIVALGPGMAGAFTNDEDGILKELLAAGKESFEPLWHMPINEEHENYIKGQFGDICNMGKGGRFAGGSSKAAAFLRRFVEGDTKWCHLDIAGPAMNVPEYGGGIMKPPVCKGQTGFGASLLIHFLRNKTKQSFEWPPLESNPDIFTTYMHSIGLGPETAVGEVFGFDEDLLAFLP